MTILDKMKGTSPIAEKRPESAENKEMEEPSTDSSQNESEENPDTLISRVERQFKGMMDQFQANAGFSVDTGEQPVDTMVELLSGKDVAISITVLLSYIRYCVNRGLKKEITLKIGYNKPAGIPMNFAVNEELIGEIYPGDVVEIN